MALWADMLRVHGDEVSYACIEVLRGLTGIVEDPESIATDGALGIEPMVV